MTTPSWRHAGAATLALLAGSASAHTGHGTLDLLAGLEHPFGLDHLLAMVAVGLWSARALPVGQRGLGPLVFLAAMSLGAVAAMAGMAVPGMEAALAASVLLMGAMLAFARRLPAAPGLGLVATAAVLHGLAHGSELPAGAGFAPYAVGFLLTTAALHLAGLALGLRFAQARDGAWRLAGSLLAGAGLVMLFPA